MTLSLNYNDDLSRVQISITDLPFSEGTARIERSTNQLYWQTVRGATALPVVGGAAVVDDYEFTADTENHYRVLAVDQPTGLHLTGTPGDYASTPDSAALDITGDLDIRANLAPNAWSGSTQSIVSKADSSIGQISYWLLIASNGRLRLVWSEDGSTMITRESTVSTTARAVRVSLDVDNGSGMNTTRFYVSDDIGGAWTQLGAALFGSGTTSVFSGSAPLEVGSRNAGLVNIFAGVIDAAEVRSGISGTVVANPAFSEQATGGASFTDGAGNVWSVHGGAAIVGAVLEEGSITPSLDGKAWLKSIRHPFLNRPIHRALAGGGQSIGRASRGTVFEVQGRSVPVAVTDIRSSREFTLTVQVPDEAAARDMDLTLASGDIFFIQVPPELAPHMTGGYVRIGESTQHREADTIMWRFTIPCTVVAPPGPGVVGGTMTYGALLNLYGGYQNLLAANSTYADVLALMASPDDLVVL